MHVAVVQSWGGFPIAPSDGGDLTSQHHGEEVGMGSWGASYLHHPKPYALIPRCCMGAMDSFPFMICDDDTPEG